MIAFVGVNALVRGKELNAEIRIKSIARSLARLKQLMRCTGPLMRACPGKKADEPSKTCVRIQKLQKPQMRRCDSNGQLTHRLWFEDVPLSLLLLIFAESDAHLIRPLALPPPPTLLAHSQPSLIISLIPIANSHIKGLFIGLSSIIAQIARSNTFE